MMKTAFETYFRSYTPYTKVYAVARTLLATGTLLTLLFDSAFLFSPEKFAALYLHNINAINLFALVGYKYVWLSKLFCIIVLVSVIAGIYPRVTGILHWWVSFSIFHAVIIKNGGDQIASNITFFLLFITVLDRRKNHWQQAVFQPEYTVVIGNIILLVIKLQVFYVYLDAVLGKLASKEWLNGTAMYYWILDIELGTAKYLLWIVKPLVMNSVTVKILTWGALLIEFVITQGLGHRRIYRDEYVRKLVLDFL